MKSNEDLEEYLSIYGSVKKSREKRIPRAYVLIYRTYISVYLPLQVAGPTRVGKMLSVAPEFVDPV